VSVIFIFCIAWSITQIAQALRKHDSTISRHLMDFKNKQKLAPENGGSQSLLKADQTEKLIQHLSEITDVHTHILYSLT
jgi:IS30 family transposase